MEPTTSKRKEETERDEPPMSRDDTSERAPTDDEQSEDEIRVPNTVPPRKNPREGGD